MADNRQQTEQQQAGQEEKKKATGLEALAKEGSEVGNIALATGTVGASAFLGGSNAAVITASFPLGRIIVNTLAGKPITAANIRDDGLAGIIFTPALIGGVKAIQSAPKYFGLESVITNTLGYSVPAAPLLVGGLNFFVLTPALNALFYPLLYLFHNKKFKGMGEDFKKNYLKSLAWTLPVNLFASGVIGAAYAGVPFIAPYLLPAIALANIGYYIFASPDISYMKKLLSPVLVPYYLAKGGYKLAAGGLSLLYKGIKGFFTGLHDDGYSINKAFKGVATAPAGGGRGR